MLKKSHGGQEILENPKKLVQKIKKKFKLRKLQKSNLMNYRERHKKITINKKKKIN